MLLGTPGGTGQTITLTQVLTNVVDYGCDLEHAIDCPRWSMDIGGNAVVEPEIDAATVSYLNSRGLDVRTAQPHQRFFFGSAECIDIRNGVITAAADHRRDAFASAL
jgi:gamma-glutamyltranspeptidase/glutathione hydrolase